MGKINLKKIGGLGKSENTYNEYDSEISYESLHYKLSEIANFLKQNNEYVCYIKGMGAHPKETYKKLAKVNGIEVVFNRSLLPKYMYIFSLIIASYEGLIRIIDPNKLEDAFLKLIECSMAGIYIFHNSGEAEFKKNVINSLGKKEFDFGIKENMDYFFYIVDADNLESSTGMYEIVSYGIDCKITNFVKGL